MTIDDCKTPKDGYRAAGSPGELAALTLVSNSPAAALANGACLRLSGGPVMRSSTSSRRTSRILRPRMERLFYLTATLLLTVAGQLVVKARSLAHATGAPPANYLLALVLDVRFLAGLGSAVMASLFWALAIQRTPLSVAYPFMALSFVLVPIGSAVLFGDRFSLVQLAGTLLIVAGVSVCAFVR